ncbi:MAG: restriction endonuclease subunit S [Methylobacter sp.]|uniref:Restriction endonuclease subunit S n=1 Tax=Candidatus Methylobacter titanis TaxID=3053457 RepID=A0AA43Q7Q4_9GAMM|nr:restriction endonuclease subunit S [Candidatus Methylobacter titanis]
MSWRELQLGDVIRLKRGHDLPASARIAGEVPIVSSSGITGFHNVAKATGPGVVTGRYGTLGEIHYIEGDYWPLNTALYVEDFKGSHPRFVAYLLKTLDLGSQNAAGAVPGVNRNTLHQLSVRIPNVETQVAIAETLKQYDDLIENNRHRIALLEESARLLYREWFVKLRFPGHELVKVVDGLPDGWILQSLSVVADFINGFAFKPTHLQNTGLPVMKIPELRDGVSAKTPRNSGELVPKRNKIDTGDLLFSWSATLLVNEWSEGPALLNQHLFKVVPNLVFFKRFLRLALAEAIPVLLGQSVGATMQHIRKSALDSHKILVPDEYIRQQFSEMADSIMDQVIVLQLQNKLLAEARDSLLPKLMSGQLAT